MARPALLLTLCGLLGCSGKPTPAPDAGVDAGVSITPVELCDRLAAARCGLKLRCYTAFEHDDLAACLPLEQTKCLAEYETIRPSFEANAVEIDATRLAACETRMMGSACPPSFPPDYPNIAAHPFSDCGLQTGLVAGKIKSGQRCDRGVDCEPGSVCIKPGGVCKGTCSSWPQEGEACGFGCQPGLICNDQGTMDPSDDRCSQPKGVGTGCMSSLECSPELICVGTCKARGKAGESCAFDPDRLSPCDPGLACDVTPFVQGATGTCVIPQMEGSKCQFHWSCAPGLVCSDLDLTNFPGMSPPPGFCRPPGQPDTNCPASPYATYVGDQCGLGTICNLAMRKCQPAPKQSEACTPSSQACVGVNVYCKPTGSGDVGTCAGPASTGERCAFDIDASHQVTVPCSSGFCDTVSTLSCQAASKPIDALCTVDGECVSGRCAVQQDQSQRCAVACN